MSFLKYFAIGLIVLFLGGCATPTKMSDSSMTRYDKDTEYALTPRPDGFSLAINYARYQFIPESSAVAISCKSALTAIAYELADKQGRKIQPIPQLCPQHRGRQDRQASFVPPHYHLERCRGYPGQGAATHPFCRNS